MNTHLAVLLEATEKFKQFSLVEVEVHAASKKPSWILTSRTDRDKCEKVESPQMVIVPPVCEIHTMLNKLANYGIMFNSSTQLFTVASFRFGRLTRVSVPLFKGGSITGTKMVSTTKHVVIQGDSFEDCSIKLFRAACTGKLYGYNGRSLERLYWDTEFNQLSTIHAGR